MNKNSFYIKLEAVLDKIKSRNNIKNDIKGIEPQLPNIKLQSKLDTSNIKKELNSKLKSTNSTVKVNTDTTQAKNEINKLSEQETKTTIQPVIKTSSFLSSLKETQKETSNFLDKFIKSAVGTNLMRISVQNVTKAISDAVAGLKELDSIKTNIQSKTGINDLEVDSMIHSYYQIAKNLSSTTKEIATTADQILRLGVNVSDTNKLVESSQILSKIGMINSTDAASYLISSMKGYQIEATNSISIIDKLTSANTNAGVSAGGLAEAISSCASYANNSGTSLDRLIGYISAVGENSQLSMSELGNSFRSIFSRINNIKSNKLIDDNTGESLSKIEDDLKKLGIHLRDIKGNYKDFDTILDDIGNHWKTLSVTEQNAVSTVLAGTNQSGTFESLMNNYTQALSLSEIATNSAGTALEHYGFYQDSISAKTNELTASIEMLSSNIISDDLFKRIIKASTGLVEFIDKTNLLKITLAEFAVIGISRLFVSVGSGIVSTTQNVKGLTTAFSLLSKERTTENLKAIGNACIGLNDKQLKLILSTKNLDDEQRKQILTAKGVKKSELDATLATLELSDAEIVVTKRTFSFSGALKALSASISTNPIGALLTAITAVTTVITTISMFSSSYKQASEEVNEKLNETIETIDRFNEEISSLKDLQESLRTAKGNKTELAKIQSELNKAIGETPDLLNIESNAYNIINQKIEDRIFRLSKLIELQKEEKIAAQKELFNNRKVENAWGIDHKFDYFSRHKLDINARDYNKYDFFDYVDDELKNKFVTVQELYNNIKKNGYGNTGKSNAEIWNELIISFGGAFLETTEIQDYFDNQTEIVQDLFKDYIENSNTIFSKEELNLILKSLIENGYSQDLEGINEIISSLINNNDLETAINDYYNSLYDNNNDSDKLYQNIISQFNELSNKYPQLKYIFDNFLSNISENIKSSLQSTSSNISSEFSDIFTLEDSSGNSTLLSDLKDNIDKVVNSYQSLKSAAKEYQTNGTLSFSTIESLIESGDDWLNYLSVEDGQLKINEQAYYDMAQAKLYELKIQALQNLSDQVKGLENVASAQNWIEAQNYDTADSYQTLSDSIIQETIAELEARKNLAETESEKDDWQKTIDLYKQQAENINKVIESTDISSILSGSTSVLKDGISNAQTTADFINTINNEITENGKISVSTLQNLVSSYPVLEKYAQDYMAGIEGSEEALIEQLNQLYQIDINNYKQAWLLKAQDNKNFWADFQNDTADTVNRLAEQYGIDLKNFDSYTQAKAALTEKISEAAAKLLDADQYAMNQTYSKDITQSAKIAGLSSDQKRYADNAWINWKENYLNAKLNGKEYNITAEQMAQNLERAGGLRASSAKQLADDLYKKLITLDIESGHTYADAYIEGLKQEEANLESSFNQYSAQYADKVAASFGESDKLTADSSSEKSTAETFNWIETKITRLTEALDKLKTKADNTYASWTSRNTALAETIAKTQEAINLQQQAYNRYMQQADSTGLSNHYKNLVQNGAMDISSISDETLKNQINEYKSWYEKAQECLKTQESLNAEINSFQTQKFDNIKAEYDAIINRMQSAYNLLESQITLLSSSSDYNSLRTKQTSIISQLQSERSALQNTLHSSGISAYTEEWYRLISQLDELDQQILDAKNTLKEIDTLQFDHIKEAFDFDTSVLEHGLQMLQTQTDLLELKGQFARESYYTGMISYTQKQLDTLVNEKNQLQTMLNHTLYTQGTSEWNDMYTSLMEIDEEIASMTNNLTEFQNSIRSLNWEIFQYLEESLNRITDETDYLIELLSKKDLYNTETGALTEYASAALGLHAAAYDVYKQQAQDYYEEVMDLQSQLAAGAGKDVLEQYHSMQDAHRDAILAAEEEKQAILDLIEEGYNAQLDALQKLIDKKKEQMQAEKNLYDYQKSIKQHTDTISSLEKQQLAYANDQSEEAMSKIQQIQAELEKAKEELAETEYEQYLSDTESMLEQLASDYEAWMNERLDHSDALLNDIIGQINTQGSSIMDTLNSVGAEYGTMISDSITSIFRSDSPFTSALTNGLSNVTTSISGTTSAINELIQKVADIAGTIAAKTNAGSNTSNKQPDNSTIKNNVVTPSAPAAPVTKPVIQTSTGTGTGTTAAPVSGRSLLDKLLIDKYDSYPKSKLSINTSIVDRLKYNNKDSSWQARSIYWSRLFPDSGAYIGSASQNTRLLNYLKGNGYSDGTMQVGRSGYYWTQENGCEIILRRSDGAILTPLSKGDAVLNKSATKNFYDMFNHPQLFRQRLDAGANTSGSLPNYLGSINDNRQQDINVGDIHVTIDLPNVKNYSEFRNNLVRDKDFENSMCVMINNAMLGKSTIEKLKYCRG